VQKTTRQSRKQCGAVPTDVDGAKNTVARPVRSCVKWLEALQKMQTAKTRPAMADAEPKTPAV